MLEFSEFQFGYEKFMYEPINFTLKAGEMLFIIGPNGSGKSTLIKAINQRVQCGGQIKLANQKIVTNQLGFCENGGRSGFEFKVSEVIEMGLYNQQQISNDSKMINSRIDDALLELDLLPLKHEKINRLSDGQYQRMLIAKLLAQDPEVLILDEPTNFLDIKHQYELMANLKQKVKEKGKYAIVVMHDLNLVNKYADKVLMLTGKNEYYFGESKAILTNEHLMHAYDVDVRKWMEDLLSAWDFKDVE
ncbi:MAG: ABC transporter ATP-binding protein [Mycoplasmatales bacterium]